MANLISVSTAPIASLGNKKYYDLPGTLEVMKQVFRESVVDGFELQLEPEWDKENPPLTDAELADWTKTPKYTAEEVLALLRKERLPILSVHASRDVGGYLCSNRGQDFEKGTTLIYDSLHLASKLGAEVCVFHLWDTWKESFDVNHLERTLSDIAVQFPKVKAAVENIPTHLQGQSPFALVRHFDYVTLDLRWATMYNELNAFRSIISSMVNVHLRGRLDGSKWTMDDSNFGFYEALDKIRNDWEYEGIFTLEPESKMKSSWLRGFLKAMRSLRI